MKYKLHVKRIHTPALVRKGLYLTKCGETVASRELIVYVAKDVTCPQCRDRPRWPTKDQQRTFDKL